MLRREVTISVSASEKLQPAPWEDLSRSVFISEKVEFEEADAGREDELIAAETALLQKRAEAQMYAALSRGMGTRSQKNAFLRAAAMDRARRIVPETMEQQCDAEAQDRTGVIA